MKVQNKLDIIHRCTREYCILRHSRLLPKLSQFAIFSLCENCKFQQFQGKIRKKTKNPHHVFTGARVLKGIACMRNYESALSPLLFVLQVRVICMKRAPPVDKYGCQNCLPVKFLSKTSDFFKESKPKVNQLFPFTHLNILSTFDCSIGRQIYF